MANMNIFDLRMVTMNMGTKNVPAQQPPPEPNESTPIEKRRQRISAYWNKVKPDIVFAQDLTTTTERSGKWSLDVGDNYVVLNEFKDKETGIAFNSDVFENEIHINADEKCKIVESLDGGFDDKDRLCAAVLRHKRTQFRLLCISWHGRQKKKTANKKRTGRLSQKFKGEYFDAMLRFVQTMADYKTKDTKYNHDAIVIGGDFNFVAVPTEIPHHFEKMTPGSDFIDYFLHKGMLTNAKVSKGEYEDNTAGAPGYLDHCPVGVDFRLNRAGIPRPCVICYKDFPFPYLNVHDGCLEGDSMRQLMSASIPCDMNYTCPVCERILSIPAGDVEQLKRAEVLIKPRFCPLLCGGAGNVATSVWCEECGVSLCKTCCANIHVTIENMRGHKLLSSSGLDREISPADARPASIEEDNTKRKDLAQIVEQLDLQEIEEQEKQKGLTKRLRDIDLWLARFPLLKQLNTQIQKAGNTLELFHIFEAVKAATLGSDDAKEQRPVDARPAPKTEDEAKRSELHHGMEQLGLQETEEPAKKMEHIKDKVIRILLCGLTPSNAASSGGASASDGVSSITGEGHISDGISA